LATALLAEPEMKAFMNMIRDAEGHSYNVVFGYVYFDDYSKHPGNIGAKIRGVKQSAAGAYAFNVEGWNDWGINRLELADFTPQSQDMAAACI